MTPSPSFGNPVVGMKRMTSVDSSVIFAALAGREGYHTLAVRLLRAVGADGPLVRPAGGVRRAGGFEAAGGHAGLPRHGPGFGRLVDARGSVGACRQVVRRLRSQVAIGEVSSPADRGLSHRGERRARRPSGPHVRRFSDAKSGLEIAPVLLEGHGLRPRPGPLRTLHHDPSEVLVRREVAVHSLGTRSPHVDDGRDPLERHVRRSRRLPATRPRGSSTAAPCGSSRRRTHQASATTKKRHLESP